MSQHVRISFDADPKAMIEWMENNQFSVAASFNCGKDINFIRGENLVIEFNAFCPVLKEFPPLCLCRLHFYFLATPSDEDVQTMLDLVRDVLQLALPQPPSV